MLLNLKKICQQLLSEEKIYYICKTNYVYSANKRWKIKFRSLFINRPKVIKNTIELFLLFIFLHFTIPRLLSNISD